VSARGAVRRGCCKESTKFTELSDGRPVEQKSASSPG